MKAKNNFILFIAVSCLIHAAFLIPATQQNIILPVDTGNIISITITKKTASTENSATTTRPTKKHEKTPITNKISTAKLEKKESLQSNNTAFIENKDIKTISEASTNESASSTSKIKIISLLRNSMQQYFYYPKLAQRRNWQGNVQLAFDVNNYGSIKNITVKESSGYEILDNAAMNALNKVHTIPDLEIKSNFYSDLKLTVKYRLEDI